MHIREGVCVNEGGQEASRRSTEVDLAPRGMMQLRGDARLHWTHGIRKHSTDTLCGSTVWPEIDRWSITLPLAAA